MHTNNYKSIETSGLLLSMFGYKCDFWVVFKEVVADYTKVVFDNGGWLVTLNNMQVTINVIKILTILHEQMCLEP